MNYYDFYYYSVCHVCKQPENLKCCKNCRFLKYCSKYHQELDWPLHKSICRAILRTKELYSSYELSSFQNWTKYRIMLSNILRKNLKRDLMPYENQMWMFPPFCNICHSTTILEKCSGCLNAFYCSYRHKEEHKNDHKLFCDQLNLCMKVDIFLYEKKWYPSVEIKSFPNLFRTFPKNNFEFLNLFVENFDSNDLTPELLLKYEIVAPSAITLYALKISNILKERRVNISELVIHIVGASNTEVTFDWQIISEIIFHYILNINSLTIYLIGPSSDLKLLKNVNSLEFCSECAKSKKTVNISVYKHFYHNVVGKLRQPNLIILFNSGLHEFEDRRDLDTWLPSFSFLLKYTAIPLVLTAYTHEEIVKDTKRLIKNSNKDLTFFVIDSENPFHNLRPNRDWNTKDKPIFYCNNFITILKCN